MKYTLEIKSSTITRYTVQNESISSIVADTGIPRSTLYHWINEYRKIQSAGQTRKITPHMCDRLEAKIARLEGLIKILKTVSCTVHAPLAERLDAIEQLHG